MSVIERITMRGKRLSCVLVTLIGIGVAGDALAGRLRSTSRGIHRAASSHRGGAHRGATSGTNRGSHQRSSSSGWRRAGGGGHLIHLGAGASLWLGGGPAHDLSGLPVRLDAYVGGSKIVGSDYGLNAEVRFTVSEVGLAARALSYFERPEPGSPHWQRLDIFTLGAVGRLVSDDSTSLGAEVGGALLAPTPDLYLGGIQAGLRLERRLGGQVALIAAVRGFVFPAGVRALEAQAGIQLGPLRASYRVLDFNVGPPLGGPELGLAFAL